MKNDKSAMPFQIMALAIPAAEAAVGQNWLPTLVLSLAAFLLCCWLSGQQEPEWKWLRALRCAALVLLLSSLLSHTHTCWPGAQAAYVVPGALLLLSMYAVWRGSAMGASSVLRYGMYLVLGVLAVLGIPQIKWSQLRPTAQLPDMGLAVILLLPLLGKKTGTWQYSPIGAIAVASAILTAGSTSLYEYSRGLSLGGITKHMESLAACAITVANFALLCFLLEAVNQREEKDWRVWLVGLAAFLLYVVGLQIRPEALAFLLLLLWAVPPVLWKMKNWISP